MSAIAAVLAVAVLRPAVIAEPLPDWDQRFRRTAGWVGGDGAYSAGLSPTRAVWLFSDTWVGAVRNGKRADVAMVNNTVGVQSADTMTFAVRRDAAGKPVAMFTPPTNTGWFWPQATVPRGGELVVFLAHVERAGGGGAFGFRQVGQYVGVVANPGDDPTAWKTSYTRMPNVAFAADTSRSYGSAALVVGDDLFVYGFDEVRKPGTFPRRRLAIAKVPLARVTDFAAWRYQAGDGWVSDVSKAVPVPSGLACELSVTYLPGRKQYAAVYTENGLSDRIVARFGGSPAGPWGPPVLVYRCPEMAADAKVFSYAAKAHPHLAAGGNELVVSYVVNGFDLAGSLDARYYWPRFVRVTVR